MESVTEPHEAKKVPANNETARINGKEPLTAGTIKQLTIASPASVEVVTTSLYEPSQSQRVAHACCAMNRRAGLRHRMSPISEFLKCTEW
jgi:hypothetical protein